MRPVALVVAPKLTTKLVLDALRRKIDSAFVPRRVIFVDALPRDALGKLPRDNVNSLLAAREPDELTVSFAFDANHPSLDGHFPGCPVIPGVVLLDAIEGRAREAFGLGILVGIAQAKFIGTVVPGSEIYVRFRRISSTRVGYDVRLHGEVVAAGELTFREREP